MKLLFDHNLSPKLVRRLADLFPASEHVYHIQLEQAADRAVCEYAQQHGFVVVTRDADYELLSRRASSPSIVWIRGDNCSTAEIERIIRDHYEQITAFGQHETARLLILLQP